MEKDYDTATGFLLENRSHILEGLEYIDQHVFNLNFLTALSDMNWKCVIVPDSEWEPRKLFPTETSFSDRETRILGSYIARNPAMFSYADRYGWAWHELVHAAIFSGNFPRKYLKIDSPFDYPLNTDEIYCYGYQMKHLMEEKRNGSLIRFALGKVPHIKPWLCVLRNALFK